MLCKVILRDSNSASLAERRKFVIAMFMLIAGSDILSAVAEFFRSIGIMTCIHHDIGSYSLATIYLSAGIHKFSAKLFLITLCCLDPDQVSKQKTNVIKKTLNPQWDEQFNMLVCHQHIQIILLQYIFNYNVNFDLEYNDILYLCTHVVSTYCVVALLFDLEYINDILYSCSYVVALP